MIDSTLTVTSDEPAGGAASDHVHDRLIFVGDLELGSPSSSHALNEIDEVRFHRGPRSVERRGRVLSLAFLDARMSNEHGRWLRRGGQWLIEDSSSKNGTIVNGELVRSSILHDGAVIELGHSFFLFRQSRVVAVPAHLAGDIDAAHLPGWPPGLRTFSPALAHIFEGLIRLATTRDSLLLIGETGTGKEVVAQAIHALSGRTGELVAVNCGALPVSLVEAELFGHRRNAFTGAETARQGLVRSADSGTLFLDEIGELAPTAQAVLLRVLQEHKVLPIGEDRPVSVDLRVIAATLRDLEAAAREGRFRPDLYARFGRVISLPALRDRREDLGLLIASMCAKHRPIRFALAAMRAILRHDWPHNIRELEQAISTARSLTPDDIIKLEHLPASLSERGTAAAEPPPALELDDEDRALRTTLSELLSRHEGNVAAVAKVLGKERSQVYKWVKRFGIDLAAFRRTP